MRLKFFGCYSILMVSFSLLAVSAQAKGDALSNVYSYDRKQFSSEGLRVNAFKVTPSLNVSSMIDDNVFAQSQNEVNDTITVISPSLAVKSDWNRHDIAINAGVDQGLYAENDDENYTDSYIRLTGNADLLRSSHIRASVGYAKKHESRSSVDNALSQEPLQYTQTDLNLSAAHKFNRAHMTLDLKALTLDYDDSVSLAGATIDNDDRDRTEYTARTRLSYELNSSYNAFVQGGYTVVSYDDKVNNRSSRGYDVSLGTEVDISGKTKGEVFAGYAQREYTDTALKSTEETTFGGNLLWSISGLTSLETGVTKKIQETTYADASGVISTNMYVDLQHELRRNILLKVLASVSEEDYQESTNQREDETKNISFEGKHLLNKNWSTILRYNYTERDSVIDGESYERNTVLFNVRYAF